MRRSREVPLAGPKLLFYKLRTGGLTWLGPRLLEEWRLPRTAAGQAMHRGARALRRAAWGGRHADPASQNSDLLYAFYDLAVAPVTFDFLWFLVGAELARQRGGLARVHVVIVPGPHDGVRRENPEYEARVSVAARNARIHNILLPACPFLPSLSGVTVAASRGQAERLVAEADGAVFPHGYEPALPIYAGPQEPLRAAREDGATIGVLRAAEHDRREVEGWLAARRCTGEVVTITLRGYDYTPERNSNIEAWAAFAADLDPARFSVVFLPDRAQCLEPEPQSLCRFPIFREAALVLGLRMALYERAYLNLGVNNGPMGLCWLNERTRYITFKMLNEATLQTSPEYMRFLGFQIGQSLPFATPWQQWVWDEDEPTIITQAFAAMVTRLDRCSTLGDAPNTPASPTASGR